MPARAGLPVHLGVERVKHRVLTVVVLHREHVSKSAVSLHSDMFSSWSGFPEGRCSPFLVSALWVGMKPVVRPRWQHISLLSAMKSCAQSWVTF